MNELYERYMEVHENAEDEELISDLKNEFTKEEMKEIFEDLEFEFKESQNKDKIAERMADKKFYEAVTEKEEEGDITIKVSKDKSEEKSEEGTKEKMVSTFNILEDLFQEESYNILKFWQNLKKEMDKGLEDIKNTHKKHMDKIGKRWDIKSDIFQEELEKTEIPKEDLVELEKKWKELHVEMSESLKEIRDEMKSKKADIKEIIYEYIGDSQRIIEDEEMEMRDLYPLWFDMIKDVREELETSKETLEIEEIKLLETWDELSTKIRKEVKDLAEEHQEEAGDLLKIWMSISEDMDKLLEQIPDKYYDIYGEFWKGFRIKRPDLKYKLMQLTEEYSDLMKDPLKSIKSTYEKLTKSSKEDEVEQLKERIARLEKKLEEKD
ncbi:MAG: hypothetical protein R6W73_00020 [Candidatus Saliniplasma sp.]